MKSLAVIFLAPLMTVGASAQSAPAATPRSGISISETSPQRFELVYSDTKFTSRDEPERKLLLSSASLALAHGQQRFVLLATPGERQDVHPPRPNPTFGAKFGHWQPHWNYHVPEYGWQWWHPEWGADFWTKDVDALSVDGVEVHAMIDLGSDAEALVEGRQFDAADVIRELAHPSGVRAAHNPH